MDEFNIKETLKDNGIVVKIRELCVFFWKRFYLFVPLLFIVFFLLGYLSEYNHLYGQSYREAKAFHVTLTDDNIQEYSIESGFTWAIYYSVIVLLIVFIVTVLTAQKNKSLDENQVKFVRKLRITRLMFIAPYAISLLICIKNSIIGVMGFESIEYGYDAFTWVALFLVVRLWWLYIICLIGIIVTSVLIIKKNKIENQARTPQYVNAKHIRKN